MFRTVLILLATALGGGAIYVAYAIPVRPNLKNPAIILAGVACLFIAFFAAVRYIDNFWPWVLPIATFMVTLYFCIRRLSDINALIKQKKREEKTAKAKDPWLAKVEANIRAGKVERLPATKPVEEVEEILAGWDDADAYFQGDDEAVPLRFMDDFAVADEADLGPQQLDMEHLDQYVFTSRHAYLIHVRPGAETPCDVATITPLMSLADLLDLAQHHECAEPEVEHDVSDV